MGGAASGLIGARPCATTRHVGSPSARNGPATAALARPPAWALPRHGGPRSCRRTSHLGAPRRQGGA
eukprot:15440284-Alexandrium_andersonii.AAC.1